MLSQNIKKARKEKGLSQESAATALHVTRQTLSKWENGTSEPVASNLSILSELLDIPYCSLLDFEPNEVCIKKITEKYSNDYTLKEIEKFVANTTISIKEKYNIVNKVMILLAISISSLMGSYTIDGLFFDISIFFIFAGIIGIACIGMDFELDPAKLIPNIHKKDKKLYKYSIVVLWIGSVLNYISIFLHFI